MFTMFQRKKLHSLKKTFLFPGEYLKSKYRMLCNSLDGKRCSSTLQIIKFLANYFAYRNVDFFLIWAFSAHINIFHVFGLRRVVKTMLKVNSFWSVNDKELLTNVCGLIAQSFRKQALPAHRLKSVNKSPNITCTRAIRFEPSLRSLMLWRSKYMRIFVGRCKWYEYTKLFNLWNFWATKRSERNNYRCWQFSSKKN